VQKILSFVSGRPFAWDGPWLDGLDPTTGARTTLIARSDSAVVDLAVRSADAAFRGAWGAADSGARAAMLHLLADHLDARWEGLVEAELRDNGKRIGEIRAQFAGLGRWYRHVADRLGDIGPESQENSVAHVTSVTQYLPYGVVGLITPWNSPLMILAWKLAPALAAGNTAVVKPSEFASASTVAFAALATGAGLPDGVLNVVTGDGPTAGAALVRHPLVRKISFTGSDTGGRRVAEVAAAGIVPVTLELGGKSAQIVLADAPLESTVNGLMSGIFLSNGQSCVAGSRLLVAQDLRDALVNRLIERAKALRLGDPGDPATQVGPLANAPHAEKVRAMIGRAIAQGARPLLDGRATAGNRPGFFVGPTILDRVTPDMDIWQDEVFGPVLCVMPFTSLDEAIRLANDSRYGLAAGIWTADPDRGTQLAARIEAGTVYVNHYRSVDPGSPIGGMKQSGYGRELGPDAIRDYMQVRSVWTGHAPVPDPFPS